MTNATRSSAADTGGWTKIGRERFLTEMRASANLSRACDRAGVTRQQAFALRAADPEFLAAWDDAEAGAFDDLEEEVLRRAREGVDKPVYFGGKVCGSVRNYNDALALEILKLRRERLNARRNDASASPDNDGERGNAIELIEERLRCFEAAHPSSE